MPAMMPGSSTCDAGQFVNNVLYAGASCLHVKDTVVMKFQFIRKNVFLIF